MSKNYNVTDDFDEEFDLDASSREKAGGYRVFSVVLFLLAVGGLFLGLLSEWADFFKPLPIVQAGTDGALNNSLLGFLIEVGKGLFTDNGIKAPEAVSATGLVGFLSPAVYYFSFVIAAAVVLSLVLAIVSLAAKTKRTAKNCMYANAFFLLLGYGGMFLAIFFEYSLTNSLTGKTGLYDLFDVPTGLISAAVLLILIGSAFARRGGFGLVNTVLFLLSGAAVFAVFYPQTAESANTAIDVNCALASGTTGDYLDLVTRIAAIAVFALVMFNLIVSVLRISAKGSYAFDIVRFALQTVAVAVLVVMYVAKPASASGAEIAAPYWDAFRLPVILLTATTVAALLFSVLAIAVKPKKAAQTEEEEEDEFDKSVSETARPAEVTAIVATEQPNKEDKRNVPAVIPESAVETPMSEFEKQMAAIAKGEMPATAPAPAAQQYDSSQYVYDPFINLLTPQEKNEFGDLFISDKYGTHAYLPAYVIGGDNKEFFSKVFIYLGKFRSHISNNLLEKLYQFVAHRN